jgi:Holliday junction DNA helicase RuvA
VYDYLEGRIAGRSAARLVLDVGGVGYDLAVPLGSGFAADGSTRVWTHMVVRDDAHQLYGFPEAKTRDLFRALLTVNGVGPRVALGVMSGLARDELVAAIYGGDLARLTAIKGVGKKTAEQILLDLRDKAERFLSAEDARSVGTGRDEIPRPDPARRERLEDAVGALISIGYSEKEARRQVDRASEKVGPEDLELLVRTAIAR